MLAHQTPCTQQLSVPVSHVDGCSNIWRRPASQIISESCNSTLTVQMHEAAETVTYAGRTRAMLTRH
jgi:hypothetical protein